MDTDKIVVTLYPRNNWQAFDLGTRLVSQWWRTLYGFWFIMAFPVFLVSMLLSVEFGLLLVWWLKPLFEMGLLHILSRNIFQQQTGIKETLKSLFSIIKPSILPALTWRRLSLNRGFNLAVSQLEGLKGDARSKRLKVLHKRNEGIYWWLIICVHLEMFLGMAFISLMLMMTPEGSSFSIFDYLLESSDNVFLMTNVFAFISMWLIAPLFQAGSFMAYLNRRIILEGWDIELQLKNIAKKLSRASKTASVAIVLLCCSISLISEPGYAQSRADEAATEFSSGTGRATSEDGSADEPLLSEEELALQAQTKVWVDTTKQELDDILGAAPFQEETTDYDWEWTGWQWEPDDSNESADVDYSFLTTLMAIIAQFAEVIFWVIFVVLIAIVLWLTRHHLARLFDSGLPQINKKRIIPDFVTQETLHNAEQIDDYNKAIEEALAAQAWRQCLSLMLISSLQVVQEQYTVTLHKSNTENECLSEILQNVPEEESGYFKSLFANWVTVAWSQNQLDTEGFNSLFALWKRYIFDKMVAS